ncbi:hypothetical protein FM110_07715 [Brachybacterium nesterenkovii]|uniref:Uncharacterized protein n=1 Tax=Brachybacterium nesterenkovii TaxID=47847 RepID=A0A1X6X1B2_9MICO|nr:hypothetical protein FM110_07715 [Brachybacterium nesterenkovii]
MRPAPRRLLHGRHRRARAHPPAAASIPGTARCRPSSEPPRSAPRRRERIRMPSPSPCLSPRRRSPPPAPGATAGTGDRPSRRDP